MKRRPVGPVLGRVVLLALAVQALAVAAVVALGQLRSALRGRASFPHEPPRHAALSEDEVTVYSYGEDLYADMLAAVRDAGREILVDSFIWKGDAVGKEFKRALADAAGRGVRVHVVFDGFANLVVPRRFKRFPADVQVLRYPVFAPGWRLFDPRRYGRDHRKLLVVDGTTGFLGGYNIGSLYATQWRDTHARVRGPACWHLHHAFVAFWNRHRDDDVDELRPLESASWDPRIRLHANVPGERRFPIRDMYLSAINRAHSHVYLSHAYFLPDEDVREALVSAVARGVDVRVLTARSSNHSVMDWLGRGLYGELLAGGVRILLYDRAMMHQKVATIDGQWTTIGTANIDRISLIGNNEVNLEIFDPGVAGHMEDIFAVDTDAAVELQVGDWHDRPVVARTLERILAPLRPLL